MKKFLLGLALLFITTLSFSGVDDSFRNSGLLLNKDILRIRGANAQTLYNTSTVVEQTYEADGFKYTDVRVSETIMCTQRKVADFSGRMSRAIQYLGDMVGPGVNYACDINLNITK